MPSIQKADLVVIGAGWHGLTAAKTYLDANPSAHVLICDSASTVGGVWAQERLYPGLRTNNQLGTYEHSDFPMLPEKYGLKPRDHIPGPVVHQYLSDFVDHFDLEDKILFNTWLETAELQENGGWLLTSRGSGGGQNSTGKIKIATPRLIVATGLTSQPSVPWLSGAEEFEAPLFHFKASAKNSKVQEAAKNICVLGGTKAGWDTVYSYASRGITVDWIIRESGHGPGWMAPAYVTPFKRLLEGLVVTRFFTWFSPCIWGFADGYPRIRAFLHQTTIGRFIVDKFWGVLGSDVITLNKFDDHPETAKLKPWTSPFFIGAGLSILNYDTNFFDLVKNGTVKVHIADITNLTRRTVNLSDGTKLSADALVCCTGWKLTPPIRFLPEGMDLGLPQRITSLDPSPFITRADKEICSQFPRLKNQPITNPNFKPLKKTEMPENFTPYCLYRFMVPPSLLLSRSLAFSGAMMCPATTTCAQLQALWITAYFGNKLALPTDPSKFKYETVLHSRFGHWRCPEGYGDRFPDLVFDSLPYFDLLCLDLGVKRHRKRGYMREIFEAYSPADYKGVVKEWLDENITQKMVI